MVREFNPGRNVSRDGEEDKTLARGRLCAMDAFGGSERILSHLSQLICERIDKRTDLRELERYAGLDTGTLSNILTGKSEVSKSVFLALKAPLDLSLDDAMGDPVGLEDPMIHAYWSEQWQVRPMRVVAFAGGSKGTSLSDNPIDLVTYVRLRAVGEFYRLR